MRSLPQSLFLAGYVLSIAWYAWEALAVYEAVESAKEYPFFLNFSAKPAAAFGLGGALYWVTFGLDRSMTPRAVLGYTLAGAHILVFALQVWIGPMFWAVRNLAE